MTYVAYALLWWLILTVIGLVAFPFVSRICNNLLDRGYCISKLVGLVIVTYVSWLLPSLKLMSFGYGVIAIGLVVLLALSWFFGRKQLKVDRSLAKSMLLGEAIFSISFAIFLLVMSRKPDIYFAYSDDFVHFGFFNSILRAEHFPPPDPWFAGEGLEYYYGGHMVMAVLTVVSRATHMIAYQLSMPLTFALVMSAAFGLGLNITRRKLYGALAALFVAVIGYLSGFFELFGYFSQQNAGFVDWMLNFNFTRSNHIIPDTVNFYPFFSILQGDMHPMNMVMPFQLMFITLVFTLFKRTDIQIRKLSLDSVLVIALMGLSLGFLLFVNSWDFAVYLLFTVLAFLLLKIRPLWIGVAAVALALLLYAPYYLGRGTGAVEGLGLVSIRTEPWDFFLLHAMFLVVLGSLLVLLSRGKLFSLEVILPGAVAIFLVAWIGHFPLLVLLLPMVIMATYFIFKSGAKEEKRFVLLLLVMGALEVLLVDSFYVNDMYGPPNERFNTLMKVYLSLWLFWGIASATAIPLVRNSLKGTARAAWTTVLVFLILASLVHPVLSAVGWSTGRQPIFGPTTGTLDGLLYLKRTEPGDYEAIRWLNETIKGSPVVLEAPGNPSSYTSRVSALTGLPTVIGWRVWEVVWRGDWGPPEQRGKDVDTIYNTLDSDEADALLSKYDVKYVFVGSVETREYSGGGLAKFDQHPEKFLLVYNLRGVKIYQVERWQSP